MTHVLAFTAATIAALAVLGYDLYAARNPITGGPR